ncbi:MAG: SDR family NAD(P)-dependent oxidoreductase, partial [Geminicoccaceae bacterium]
MTDLSSRHALVSGGGSGVGAAIALALAEAGADVTIVGRREAVLAKTAGQHPL